MSHNKQVAEAIRLAAEALDGLDWPEPAKTTAIRLIRELADQTESNTNPNEEN